MRADPVTATYIVLADTSNQHHARHVRHHRVSRVTTPADPPVGCNSVEAVLRVNRADAPLHQIRRAAGRGNHCWARLPTRIAVRATPAEREHVYAVA